jgi:hypothetical protein
MMTSQEIDEILIRLTNSTRNNAIDAAARVARLYGAPEEACQHILMLKAEDSKNEAA